MNEQLKDLVNDIKSLIYDSNVNFGILKFSLVKWFPKSLTLSFFSPYQKFSSIFWVVVDHQHCSYSNFVYQYERDTNFLSFFFHCTSYLIFPWYAYMYIAHITCHLCMYICIQFYYVFVSRIILCINQMP